MSVPFSRRDFLAQAGAMASVPFIFGANMPPGISLVSDPDYKYVPDPKLAKIKLGIIGVGGRGNALLGEILKSQQTEVVAICDLRPEAITAATARCSGMTPKGYEKYQDLLAQKDIEAVVIATPVDFHREMAIAAIDSNKHIYCEKPLGLDAKQADDVYNKAKDYKKVFQVGFQWVYNRNFLSAVQAAHEGVVGDIRFIHAQRHGGDLPRDKGKTWLFERNRSGDIIVEQAVHEMNVICWGLKANPTKANGFGGTNVYVEMPPGRTIMDHYSLSMQFPGCDVSYSHLYYAGKAGGSHIRFFGSKGVIDVMEGQVYLEGDAAKPAPKPMKLTNEDTFNAFLSFFDKVRNGGQADADAYKGMIATKACALGRTAIYEGRTVTWDELHKPEFATAKL